MKINIYQSEIDDNLEEAIANNNSISYCVRVEPNPNIVTLSKEALAKLNHSFGSFNMDLFYPTKSILVTTSWNKNDDVFGPLDTWAARYTPVHTPTNINHDHNQMVGHITSTWAIDAKGNLIDDDTDVKDLPNKFHLCNSAVIYKYNRVPDYVARAEKLIEEIESGKKFVSMECLFPGFDYAIISPENEYKIVERNESTAFLTKHLRIYGGSGSYQGNKIGRFLKKMVFSGKGYVDEPANPESIIFDAEAEFNFSAASFENKWFEVKDKTMISVPVDIKVSFTQSTENELMAEENKLVEELKAEVANLNKQLLEVNAKALQDEITELKNEVAEAKKSADEKKAAYDEEEKKSKAKDAAVAELTQKIEELTASNAELTTKVEEAAANQLRAARVSTLVDGGIAKEEAEAKVTKFAALNDEQFNEVAAALVSAVKPADTTTTTTTEVDETTLANVQVEETVAGAVAETETQTTDMDALRVSIARYINPDFKTDGEE